MCERHWPQGYETVKRFGKERPRYPPSVFACVKPSLQRTPAPATRTTKRTYSEVRNQRPDELNSFNEADRILNHETFKSEVVKHNFGCPVTVSTTKNEIYLQSEELLESTGIFEFMLKIKEDFLFEGFHCGVKCTITSLSQNRITRITRWSQLDEAIRFLKNIVFSRKETVLHEQAAAMGIKGVGERKFSNSAIVQAFGYFALSRTSYNRLRQDFELPSIATLTRMTSSTKQYDDIGYYSQVFENLPDRQKNCIVLVDEVYVKSMLQYHGGEVFGHQ